MNDETVTVAEVAAVFDAIIGTIMLSDPTAHAMSNKLNMLESMIGGMAAGTLRERMTATLQVHRAIVAEMG